jgi:hypothetical protein
MKTFDVGIAVNATIHLSVDAANEEAALRQAEEQFMARFNEYIQQVDPKACYVEDAEEIT